MLQFLIRRLLLALITMLVAVSLIFIAIRVLPGNPLLARFGQHVDQAQMEKIKQEQGWNRPILQQLGTFLNEVFLHGDLGQSIARPTENVGQQVLRRLPATIELTLAAMIIAVPFGISFGVAAAVWRNRFPDYFCMIGSLIGVSVPVFFLGICLRAIFTDLPTSQRLPSYVFDFEPLTGLYLIDTLLRGRFELFLPALKHLLLPAIALSSIPTAIIARITRSSMLDVLSADYVRTARAKGNSRWRVVWRHAFPNASVPIVNIAGFQIGLLLSGAVLTETVFDWPGMGKYIVDAVPDKDYVVVQAGALVIATIFVMLNLFLDVVYAWLDPRIRTT
ncbi:MAG: ABC transporter permease [Planctomycetes bacterium]|nr:ABC transporter permease [Planctomycetota bacterium]